MWPQPEELRKPILTVTSGLTASSTLTVRSATVFSAKAPITSVLTLGTSLALVSFATSSLALSGTASVPTSATGYLTVLISGTARRIPYF